MKKQINRLIVAALASSSVFGATYLWYQYTNDTHSFTSNEKPLAFVGNTTEDIQRRQASRLLWQIVKSGEALYNGEAIRTGSKGEVRILFAESNQYLDLEPDSLIVIKKSAGEIALDLMEGGLFVNNSSPSSAEETTTSTSLVLNSTKGKVDLTNASVSLSKLNGQELDLKVIEGSAILKSESGTTSEVKNSESLKVMEPKFHKEIFVNAEQAQPTRFSWEGSTASSHVSLYAGSSRRTMTPVATASANAHSLSTKLPFGTLYWKLVATSPEGSITETPTYRTDVLARYSPAVIFPLSNASILVKSFPHNLTFAFNNTEAVKDAILEIWSDEALKTKVSSSSINKKQNLDIEKLSEGTYFWRLTSYYEELEQPLIGTIQRFTLTKKAPINLLVDFTNEPMNSTQYFIKKPEVQLSWNANEMEHVASWNFKLYEENQNPAEVTSSNLTKNNFKGEVPSPGRYIASVEALDADGLIIGSKISPVLNIQELPILKSPNFEGPVVLEASLDGRADLKWTQINGAREYWVEISRGGKVLTKSKYTRTFTSLKNLHPGEYDVQIYAVDTHERNGEMASPRKLIVPDKSNIQAPTLKKIKVN